MTFFKTSDVAKTAWAFAKAGRSDAELFMALARQSEGQISNFNA